jgi:hypothetical protein
VSRPDLNPWHDAVLAAGDLIDAARTRAQPRRAAPGAQPHLDGALRILDALIGGAEEEAALLTREARAWLDQS